MVDGLSLDLALQTSRFEEARSRAFATIKDQAQSLRADAIIGLRFEYCAFGKNGLLNMVSAYGTAVRIQFSKEDQERHRIMELREKTKFMVSIDGKQRGPFSIEQLAQLVDQGRVSPTTILQVEDTGEVIPLSELLR